MEDIKPDFYQAIIDWLGLPKPELIELKHSTEEIILFVMQQADS